MFKGPTVSTTFNAIDKVTRPMKKMTAGMKRFAAIGGAAVLAGLALTTRAFIQFDESLTAASAKFGDLNLATEEGQATLKRLGETAREVGATTKFSATEAAQGLDFLAMAGFTAEQAMTALPQVVNLATVAQTDLATATDIASDSLGAFGLMTDDATQLQENFTRINDVMAKTMTSSNTNMTDLFETVKAGAPTFTAAGQSLESFAAMAGIMANSGVKGSTSGTSLRNVMLKLADPTSEAAKEMENLGVVTQDENGNFRDIIDILADFETGLVGMGTAQKTAALSTIFGARSVTGINVLLQSGSEALRDYRTELEGASGAAQEMADIIGSSLSNQLKSLKSAALEKGFQLIERFAGDASVGITKLTESIRAFDIEKYVQLFKDWAPVIKGVVAGFVAFKAVMIMGTTIQGIMALVKAIQAAAAAQGILNVVMAANPIGAVAFAVAGLIALLATLQAKYGIFDQDVDPIATEERKTQAMAEAGSRTMGLVGRNDAVVGNRAAAYSRLDVNFNNTPQDTTVKQTGYAPNINLNTGFGGGGL